MSIRGLAVRHRGESTSRGVRSGPADRPRRNHGIHQVQPVHLARRRHRGARDLALPLLQRRDGRRRRRADGRAPTPCCWGGRRTTSSPAYWPSADPADPITGHDERRPQVRRVEHAHRGRPGRTPRWSAATSRPSWPRSSRTPARHDRQRDAGPLAARAGPRRRAAPAGAPDRRRPRQEAVRRRRRRCRSSWSSSTGSAPACCTWSTRPPPADHPRYRTTMATMATTSRRRPTVRYMVMHYQTQDDGGRRSCRRRRRRPRSAGTCRRRPCPACCSPAKGSHPARPAPGSRSPTARSGSSTARSPRPRS